MRRWKLNGICSSYAVFLYTAILIVFVNCSLLGCVRKQWFVWILVLYCFATGFWVLSSLILPSCSDMILMTHMVCYLILFWLRNGLHWVGSVWFCYVPSDLLWFWICFGYNNGFAAGWLCLFLPCFIWFALVLYLVLFALVSFSSGSIYICLILHLHVSPALVPPYLFSSLFAKLSMHPRIPF